MNEKLNEIGNQAKLKLHKVSVREIIDFIMRSGDITSVSLSSGKMTDGTKAHSKFQKAQKEECDYNSEVPIFYTFTRDEVSYLISGRIDGILFESNDLYEEVIIDEIKSTGSDISGIKEGRKEHWAQVKMYAYMYMMQEKTPKISCRLTYIELETFQIKQFKEEMTFAELELFFNEIMDLYAQFAKMIDLFENEMILSSRELEFPFDSIRDGQEKLMKGTYLSIKNKQILFSRAPTGTGKTIATLFPSVKAIGEGITDKVFYLTAKTIGKEVAVNTTNQMMEQGLSIKYVVITAKDKICIHTETSCNPETCPYAKGHYDRINTCIKELYEEENQYTREVITRAAIKHSVCPYELSLDLALFSQIIICDYNYVFDPSAMLRRFFVEGSGKYTLLIDEAHNLVDRSRNMYSAVLKKEDILRLKKLTKDLDSRLYGYLDKLNKTMIDYRKELKEAEITEDVRPEPPLLLETYLRGVIYRTEKIFKIHRDWIYMEALLDFYFLAYDFVKKFEMYGDNYRTYYELQGQELIVKLFCVDPRQNLIEILNTLQGVIYFSATLIPMPYYKHLLGGDESSYGMNLESPFNPNQLRLLCDSSISTKYIHRESSLSELIDRIYKFTTSKIGNYLVYFPSYAYMEQGIERFKAMYGEEEIQIEVQERYLNEEGKEAFIEMFSETFSERSLVAFAVLGGMFGEGIDLTGEKLVGAVIVGVGLPKICFEQNIIRDYFEETMGTGFEYAYTYPGMNKVLQAAGRVIRTTEDKGSVLLIDERFKSRRYQRLFPKEWNNLQYIQQTIQLEEILGNFWDKSLD